jgi:two-component system chemotaxis response regulator CheB
MPKLVVIGTSEGGVAALQTLVSGLPADFPAPILIVQHVGQGPSFLPNFLNQAGTLRAAFAKDSERMSAGQIYVAPPDYHLRISDGKIELSRGPRENWTRPAIDPLFRTAAEAYGPDVIGVVLTGNLNDGTVGLHEIKRRGGTAIVQDPKEAIAPSMPRNALEHVEVDHSVSLAEMPELLNRLTAQPDEGVTADRGVANMTHDEPKLEEPVAQTCPECGGAMKQKQDENIVSFRCHIGHNVTAEVLASVQVESMEKLLMAVVRALNERADLCREMAGQCLAKGDVVESEGWRAAEKQARDRSGAVRELVEADWARPGNC